MAWTYRQATGEMVSATGVRVFHGYAGAGLGKNNPLLQDRPNVGPLPCGGYTIDPPINTKTHGPFVLWLEPDVSNEMHGRSAFGIHGDSIVQPGTASEGCIILDREARETIWNSGDRRLNVVADATPQSVPPPAQERASS